MDSFCGEIAYRFAEPINNSIQGRKYLISKTSEAYFLPNLFYGVHFRRIWRNEEQANIIWYIEFCRLMPCGTVATQKNRIIRISLGECAEKHIHALTITAGHNQKMPFSSQRFYRSIHIPIFPYMMAWNARTLPSDRLTVFGFIDPAETSFILKHQAYFWSTRFLHFGYGCFNFFEASIASSLAFFGCLDLGIIFLQPCRWST